MSDVTGNAEVANPAVAPTIPWATTQLIPSPEVAAGDGSAHFGLRWQVTPLLYSFGIHRGLFPWRAFVVEPLVRQNGSIEAYFTPEYVAGDWLVRPGARVYFPLLQHGDNLSFSIGGSAPWFHRAWSASIEGGLYALFGILGITLTYTPATDSPVTWITTLRVRYF
jgi:hypothetical protein